MKRVVAVEVATELVDKKWMSLQEVLIYTGLTKRTLEALRKQGKVKTSKIAYRTILYEKESLEKFINQNIEET